MCLCVCVSVYLCFFGDSSRWYVTTAAESRSRSWSLDMHTHRQTDRQTDMHTHTDRQTHRRLHAHLHHHFNTCYMEIMCLRLFGSLFISSMTLKSFHKTLGIGTINKTFHCLSYHYLTVERSVYVTVIVICLIIIIIIIIIIITKFACTADHMLQSGRSIVLLWKLSDNHRQWLNEGLHSMNAF